MFFVFSTCHFPEAKFQKYSTFPTLEKGRRRGRSRGRGTGHGTAAEQIMVVTRMQNYLGQMKTMVEDQEKSYKRVVQYGQIPIQDHHHNRYVRRGDFFYIPRDKKL